MNNNKLNNIGKIYILRNNSLKENVIKIGLTTRTSELRASELSKTTGVPENFEVLYEEDVVNCKSAEKIIHEKLDGYRVSSNREFFRIPLKLAVKTVFSICSEVNNEGIQRLAIIINSALISEENMVKIKNVILGNKGCIKTRMHIIVEKRSETVIQLPNNMCVYFSERLIRELLSIDCVKDVIYQ